MAYNALKRKLRYMENVVRECNEFKMHVMEFDAMLQTVRYYRIKLELLTKK